MNETIRRGQRLARAAVLSLVAIVAAANCFALGIDGDFDPPLAALGDAPLEINQTAPIGFGVPVTGYNSRPGAPYTIYLDFGGFAFSGNWGNNASQTPGTTPAYTIDGDASTFNATELANIKIMWSRVAEKYSGFDVNVTTVDPAVAAGQNGTDALRQAFYDNTAKLMHTVIGGSGSWAGTPTPGGTSYVGVTASQQPGSNGYHTDWVFAAQAPNSLRAISEAVSHENGHGLSLIHQCDFNGCPSTDYSTGTGTGPGSKAPIMGNSYSSERGLWRIGPTNAGTQNDLAKIMSSNSGIGPIVGGFPSFINDGVGHSSATATALPLNGTDINFNAATGVIVPTSPTPTSTSGEANYVSDYWSFSTTGSTVWLSVVSGRETITPGVADPGATLDASLEILDPSSNTILFSSATSGLTESLTASLGPGTYVARVLSAADPTGSGYYDIGSYFLVGSLSVPEPATLALVILAAACCGGVRRRRPR